MWAECTDQVVYVPLTVFGQMRNRRGRSLSVAATHAGLGTRFRRSTSPAKGGGGKWLRQAAVAAEARRRGLPECVRPCWQPQPCRSLRVVTQGDDSSSATMGYRRIGDFTVSRRIGYPRRLRKF